MNIIDKEYFNSINRFYDKPLEDLLTDKIVTEYYENNYTINDEFMVEYNFNNKYIDCHFVVVDENTIKWLFYYRTEYENGELIRSCLISDEDEENE